MADWTDPPTLGSGDFYSAADFNTYTRDNGLFLRNVTSYAGGGPFYFAAVANDGASTSLTDFYNSGTIVTPDYDYVLSVIGTGTVSGNPSALTFTMIATDGSGVSLPQQIGLNNGGFTVVRMTDADTACSFSFAGGHALDANDSAVVKLQYVVSNSSVDIDVHMMVFITPV